MTDLGYMIWFLGTAAFTITVLAVGTLAAAGAVVPAARDRSGARTRVRAGASTSRVRPRSPVGPAPRWSSSEDGRAGPGSRSAASPAAPGGRAT